MSPDSARWRIISPRKNGLPSVSRWTALASSSPGASRSCPRGELHERRDPVETQSEQIDALDARLAAKVGEDVGERMRAVEVGVAIRSEDQQADGLAAAAAGSAEGAATACRPSGCRRARAPRRRIPRSPRRPHRRLRTDDGVRHPGRRPAGSRDPASVLSARGRAATALRQTGRDRRAAARR